MRHLKIYRAIRLIQRHGSIRKAAEVLAISSSALNRSIQAFEEEMNAPIFERLPGGVRLSVAGELLIDMIERHLIEFDDMQDQLSNLRDGLAGTLRLSVASDLDAGLVMAAVAAFEIAFPGVSVELRGDDTTAPLRQRFVDLAVLSTASTDDGLEVLYSHAVPLVAVDLRPHGSSDPLAEGLASLVRSRLMLPPEGTGARVAFSHLLRRRRLAETVVSALSASQLGQAQIAQAQIGQTQGLRQQGGICVFPDIALPPGPRLALDLGAVQVAVLRAAKVPMTRPAQAFLAILQRSLDAATVQEPSGATTI